MRILRKPHPVTMFIVWFLTVFLVLFPKGGMKIGVLPLTWGYMFFVLTTPVLIVVRVVAFDFRLPMRIWAVIGMLLPMQLLIAYTAFFYGILDPPFALSTITGLMLLPWIFILIYPPFLHAVDGERFSRYFRLCILFAALWGIFLFVWHPLTGKFIEVPYLTVNVEDYGQLETTKRIARGLFFKLISTYNNGNLYGVSMLMLLPLYNLLEKARWRRIVIRLALLLTLSRTVWAGLVVAELMPLGLLAARQVGTFPRVAVGRAWKQLLTLAVTIALIFAALLLNSSKLSFLFDPTLGGRQSMFTEISNATLLPNHGLIGFQEVLYVSAAKEFGYIGMVAFTLLMLSPVLLLFIDSGAMRSPSRRAALKGLILYAFVASSDGALNFIPVMAFYWFVYMIYLFGWPSSQSPAALRIEGLRACGNRNAAHALPEAAA